VSWVRRNLGSALAVMAPLVASCRGAERSEVERDAAAATALTVDRPREPATPPSGSALSTPAAQASATGAVDPVEPAERDPGAPVLRPETARGRCTGWDSLEAEGGGAVRCYPYRCRNDRCLTSCTKREDCAGSLGPADLAEHGWPLDCINAGCVPLPPSRVRR
jgi:hypothetical protein